MGTINLVRSFMKHHLRNIRKYILSRTLHNIFHIDDELYRMGIKMSSTRAKKKIRLNTFFHCKYSTELWTQANDWIIELGMENYNLSNTKIIVGD